MPKIPEEELQRLKDEVDLLALVRARGVELKKKGEDYHGLCPFHGDKNPSMVVTPAKGLWNCFACDAGGTVIDWVMKSEGVNFKHALELLREKQFTKLLSTDKKPKVSTKPLLKSPLSLEAPEQELLAQVIDYYHQRLKTDSKAREYLKSRSLLDDEMIDRFKIGFSDRTLGLRLERKNRNSGKAIRERLQSLGIVRSTGHEHFRGSITIPVFDESGNIREIYGRKITPNLRKGTPNHTYLPGPHGGVFNSQGILEFLAAKERESEAGLTQSDLVQDPSQFGRLREVVLCESLFDALSFYKAGVFNVTCSFGTQGFNDEILGFFITHKIARIYIAYDSDKAGEQSAKKLCKLLVSEGFEVHRIHFPLSCDANEFLMQEEHPKSSFKALIQSSSPVHLDHPDHVDAITPNNNQSQKNQGTSALKSPSCARLLNNSLAAKEEESMQNQNPPMQNEPLLLAAKEKIHDPDPSYLQVQSQNEAKDTFPLAAKEERTGLREKLETPTRLCGEDILISLGEREYRVRGLSKNLSYDILRVNLRVSRGEYFHVDTLDLYHARNRSTFINVASQEIGENEMTIKRDLGRILLKLEELQEIAIQEALKPKEVLVEIPEHEREKAIAFLKSKNLMQKIVADFHSCGIVGERINVLTGYLAATSRLLERPLGVVIQSSSAAGKTSLMESVLSFMPEESKVKYSAMTGQSLFYMGETDLKGKILAIVEEEGAERASYALKLLQSEGELTIASTGKESKSGRMITHEYKVEGPTMVFLTSTAIDIDEEFLNRCIVLSVNESREQTKAIHNHQRFSQTLQGLLQSKDRLDIKTKHQNAQRLLRPLLVANPYAQNLSFLSDKTRTRRDHLKYQYLIRSIALLRQYQKKVKTCTHEGVEHQYIEVDLEDIELANEISHEVLGRSLDELPPQTRKLLSLIYEMVHEKAKAKEVEQSDLLFSRKEVRDFSGWGNTQLKVHMARLVDLEYLLCLKPSKGSSYRYELLYKKEDENREKFLMGLIDVEQLREKKKHNYDSNWSGLSVSRSGSGRGLVGTRSGGGRCDLKPDLDSFLAAISPELAKISISPPEKRSLSYTKMNPSDRGL